MVGEASSAERRKHVLLEMPEIASRCNLIAAKFVVKKVNQAASTFVRGKFLRSSSPRQEASVPGQASRSATEPTGVCSVLPNIVKFTFCNRPLANRGEHA